MLPQLGIWKRFTRSLLGVDRCSLSWGSGSPPPKQMESIDQSLPNLTLSHEQTFHFPSSLSSGGDCQSPIKNEGRPCSTMTTTMFKPSDSMSAKERPLPAEPFTVDSEDSYSDHTYEHIDSGSLLVEDGNLSTFATDYRFAPLVPAKMPVGIQGDSASRKIFIILQWSH